LQRKIDYAELRPNASSSRPEAIRTIPSALGRRAHQMGDQVSWLLELAVKPGEVENFRALMNEMVESTRAESGTLGYEWFISDDGSVVHIYERYLDSAAVMTHLGAFGEKFAERFLAAVDPTRFTVFGSPSDEVREAQSGLGPTYLGFFGGFAR
jgi:quinol monooxygenase YgiN